jgi:hypothetical protein
MIPVEFILFNPVRQVDNFVEVRLVGVEIPVSYGCRRVRFEKVPERGIVPCFLVNLGPILLGQNSHQSIPLLSWPYAPRETPVIRRTLDC